MAWRLSEDSHVCVRLCLIDLPSPWAYIYIYIYIYMYASLPLRVGNNCYSCGRAPKFPSPSLTDRLRGLSLVDTQTVSHLNNKTSTCLSLFLRNTFDVICNNCVWALSAPQQLWDACGQLTESGLSFEICKMPRLKRLRLRFIWIRYVGRVGVHMSCYLHLRLMMCTAYDMVWYMLWYCICISWCTYMMYGMVCGICHRCLQLRFAARLFDRVVPSKRQEPVSGKDN